MPDKADETVQRVKGDLMIDAKSIDDSMYGAWSLWRWKKRTAIEMMRIQEGMGRMSAMLSWRSKFQRERFYDDGYVWKIGQGQQKSTAKETTLDKRWVEDLTDRATTFSGIADMRARACDVSMLQSSLPLATDRTLMKPRESSRK